MDSLTKTKVGWPAAALASTMNFPMYPVPPMIKILLFPPILKEYPVTDSKENISLLVCDATRAIIFSAIIILKSNKRLPI